LSKASSSSSRNSSYPRKDVAGERAEPGKYHDCPHDDVDPPPRAQINLNRIPVREHHPVVVLANTAWLYTGTNPKLFDGTVVEDACRAEIDAHAVP
jgi:hypothetical protein